MNTYVMSEDAKRELATKYMLSLVDYEFDNPKTKEMYLDTILPFDAPTTANYDGKTMSSCALTAMALMRVMSGKHDGLYQAYNPRWIGQAPTIVRQCAVSHGAWVDCRPQSLVLPKAGDIVFVGGPDLGGIEHLLVCVEDASKDGFDTVEGGQLGIAGHHSNAIRKLHRRILDREGNLYVSRNKPYLNSYDRRIRGWVDIGKMPVNLVLPRVKMRKAYGSLSVGQKCETPQHQDRWR